MSDGSGRSAAGGRAHDLDQGAGAGGRGGPLRPRDHAAVDGDRHPLGVVLARSAPPRGRRWWRRPDLDRLAVHPQRERRSCGCQRLDERCHRPAPDEVDDRRRGERGEQDAVAVVADGRHDAVEARSSRCAACCRAWRAAARWPPRAARARRRRARSPARRRAARARRPPAPRCRLPRSSTVAPTTTEPSRRGTRYTERPCTRPRTVAGQQRDGRGGVRRAEAQDVALDGAERGEPGAGEPVDGAEAGPGRQDDVVRAEAAAVRQDELRARPPARPRVPSTNVTPPRRQASASAPSSARLSTWWSPGTSMPPRRAGLSAGTSRRHVAGAAAVGLEPERVLVGEEVVEAGAVGRIERDRHRARRVVADVVTGGGLERAGEGGPAAGALAPAGPSGRTRRTAPRSPGRACRPPPRTRRRVRGPARPPSLHDRCVTIPTHRPGR